MAQRQPHVEIFKDRRWQYRWRLVAGNGEVVASGEGHGSKRDAVRAWDTVARIVVRWCGYSDLSIGFRDLTTSRRSR